MEQTERLRDAAWVAAALGLRRDRIYELVRQNMVPHVKIGRQIRFRPADVEEWLAGGGTPLHAVDRP